MPVTYEADAYYRFSPFARNWLATSGIMNYCETHQCHWVLDVVASYVPQLAKTRGVDYFLILRVTVNPDKTAVFTIEQEENDREGNSRYRTLIRQEIPFTDLRDSWTFWAINESSGGYEPHSRTVVLLPEEY